MIICVLLITGCIDSSITILIKPDGSGTITQTMFMSPAITQMINSMNQGNNSEEGRQKSVIEKQLDPAQYKAQALRMGEGVTFESCKEIKKEDGSSGVEVVFTFNDINKLKITPSPQSPVTGNQLPEQPGEDKLMFNFVKGDQSRLTISIPQKKSNNTLPPPAGVTPPEPENNEKPSPEQIQMLKQMFNGFRFRFQIKVEGEIIKSNASYIEKGATGKKQIVTLFDMDISKLLNDQEKCNKLFSMGRIQDITTAREKLKDFKELRLETVEKLEILFK